MKKIAASSVVALVVIVFAAVLRADDDANVPPPVRIPPADAYHEARALSIRVDIDKDPESAAIVAVHQAKDMLDAGDIHAEIQAFTSMLADSNQRSVRRAIRFALVDIYNRAGQGDQAMQQIRALVTEQE